MLDATTLPATLYIAFWLFLIALAITWILLPFAIVGIKPLLKEIVAEARRATDEARRANDLLRAVSANINAARIAPPHPRDT